MPYFDSQSWLAAWWGSDSPWEQTFIGIFVREFLDWLSSSGKAHTKWVIPHYRLEFQTEEKRESKHQWQSSLSASWLWTHVTSHLLLPPPAFPIKTDWAKINPFTIECFLGCFVMAVREMTNVHTVWGGWVPDNTSRDGWKIVEP